jgi:predicted nucleotidyltransferase
VPDPITYAEQNRVFVLRHEKSGIDVDLSIGGLPFEIEAFRRARRVKINRLTIRIATVEDLIIMKAVANRRQDQSDIAQLMDDAESLDYEYIRFHLDDIAAILELPDLYTTIDGLLREHRKGRRRRE